MTLQNKHKILSALQQLDTKISKPDLEKLTGIIPKNISRYINALEKEKLVKAWIEQLGNKRTRFVKMTKKGKEFELPEQLDITDIKDISLPEPKEPKPLPKLYRCKICEFTTDTSTKIKTHLKKEHRELLGTGVDMFEFTTPKPKPKAKPKPKEITKKAVKEIEVPEIKVRFKRTSLSIIADVLGNISKDSMKSLLSSDLKRLRTVLTNTGKNYTWVMNNIKIFLEYALDKGVIQ